MRRVGIAHHHSAITVGGAHPTATFSWTFVSQRLMRVHSKITFQIPLFPPFLKGGTEFPLLKKEGNQFPSLKKWDQGGFFMHLCEPLLMWIHLYPLQNSRRRCRPCACLCR